MNWNRILIRGMVPLAITVTIAIGVLAFLSALSQIGSLPVGPKHAFWMACVVLSIQVLIFFRQIRRRETGAVDPCQYCGGPLGYERAGKVYYGRQLSDFRGCYHCGKANSMG